MAKLVAYKQVKRNGSKSVKGALKKAVNTNIFAANQLGSTLNSVGSITTDLVKISEAFRKTRITEDKDERRQRRLDKDQAAEDRQEGKKVDEFNKSGKDGAVDKEFKKKKKPTASELQSNIISESTSLKSKLISMFQLFIQMFKK